MNNYFSTKKKAQNSSKSTSSTHNYQLRGKLPCSTFTPAGAPGVSGASGVTPVSVVGHNSKSGKTSSLPNSPTFTDNVTFKQSVSDPPLLLDYTEPTATHLTFSSDSDCDEVILDRTTPSNDPNSVHPSNYYYLTDNYLPPDPSYDADNSGVVVQLPPVTDSVVLPAKPTSSAANLVVPTPVLAPPASPASNRASPTANNITIDTNSDTDSDDNMTDMPSLGIPPPTFSGTPTENAEAFKQDFESYCVVNNIKADRKFDVFKLLLKGLALNWFQNLKDTEKPDYATAITHFDTAYINTKHPWVKLQKLNARKLLPTESVDDYIRDVLALCPEEDSTSKMNHLLNGLDVNDRATLMCQNPSDLNDLVHKLVLLRASNQVRSQSAVNSIEEATNIASISNTLARIEERLQRPLMTDNNSYDRRGRSQSPPAFRPQRQPYPSRSPSRQFYQQQPRPFTGRCFRCNRTGHTANTCRTPPPAANGPPNGYRQSRFPANRGRQFQPPGNRFPPRNRSPGRRLNN